ncbi:DsbA family protein [Streptomyces sp. NPDC091377]|uniref:DsbA family protein n=1 Tax=Streptomyces sp. NPDC091377 TaxID=3365995 RepID=UPI003814A3BC
MTATQKPLDSPERPSPRSRSHRRRILAAGTALVVAASTAVFALTLDGSPDRGPRGNEAVTVTEDPAAAPVDESLLALARRDPSDTLAVGREDAPVVMIEYSDFQCPYCGRFARETKPELLRSYVDKGVLRIEWRNFPLFGEESERAALAAWAAGQQKNFWPFHDVVYAEPRKRNSGQFTTDKLVAMAREAGVPDLDRFRADMDSDKAREAIGKDRSEGYALGVSSTPAFLVNGRPLLGAQPTDTFVAAIEAAAKATAK